RGWKLRQERTGTIPGNRCPTDLEGCMLKNRFFSIFAVAALVGLAACGGRDETGEGETVSADTATVQGMDTVQTQATVPTTDTVVTTTTIDTIQGQARDTTQGGAGADTTRRP
ncbi:MAG TPA: hypothetical protein VHG28_18080, partial [Longimicrobiaceae bacterium]|nr:hypothetical protein [Longimicrobiaceae bacterium]